MIILGATSRPCYENEKAPVSQTGASLLSSAYEYHHAAMLKDVSFAE